MCIHKTHHNQKGEEKLETKLVIIECKDKEELWVGEWVFDSLKNRELLLKGDKKWLKEKTPKEVRKILTENYERRYE